MLTQELEILLYKYSFFEGELNLTKKENLSGCFTIPNRNGELIWHSDYLAAQNLLENYPIILDSLNNGLNLALRYYRRERTYEGELFHLVREGGYKEPFHRENIIKEQHGSLNVLLGMLEEALEIHYLSDNKQNNHLIREKKS